MLLSLERCAIRSWRPDDVPRLAAIANDRSVWLMVRDRFPFPYTEADAAAHIATCLSQEPQTNFAITVGDVVIGAIGHIPGEDINRVRSEVGYWLCAESRGKGYATEALRGFVQWLWRSTALHHLTAAVFTHNPASARVLEKAGFERTYLARKCAIKDGELRDEWNYSLVREAEP